jgi:hypothetical protein
MRTCGTLRALTTVPDRYGARACAAFHASKSEVAKSMREIQAAGKLDTGFTAISGLKLVGAVNMRKTTEKRMNF